MKINIAAHSRSYWSPGTDQACKIIFSLACFTAQMANVVLVLYPVIFKNHFLEGRCIVTTSQFTLSVSHNSCFVLFWSISELSSHGGTYRPLHSAGVGLLTAEEKHQRLCQSGIHQPGQTQQSLLT